MTLVHGNRERGEQMDETTNNIEASIFGTLKTMLLGNSDDDDFDTELKVHINKSLSNLYRNGLGDSEFRIVTGDETWESLAPNVNCLGSIKDYIYFDVKIAFDPPTSSIVMETYKQLRDEALWTINTEMELSKEGE